MPGLTLVAAATASPLNNRDISNAQQLLIHARDYRVHSAVDGENLHIGWVAYDGYPVHTSTAADCFVYLEGRIYNNTLEAIQADLVSLATSALHPRRDDSAIRRFTQTNDGSYIVTILRPRTGELIVFTDVFGRLPLYYSFDNRRLILAREAKFVQKLRTTGAFDRIGCAQYVAFGLPLGDRTLLDGVKVFPDAGLLRADIADAQLRCRISQLVTWNLDDEDPTKSVREEASDFADLFKTACRSWGKHRESRGSLVSLSGGHDSRAVAAGFKSSSVPFVALTYRDPNGKRENEVECARQLSKVLDIDWRCIDLPFPAESAYERLAWLKDGLNWTSMAFILEYLQRITDTWGRGHTYFSGDGGDDCLKVTAPGRRFEHIDDVVQYILAKESYIRPSVAEGMLRLPAGTLRQELSRVFDAYPEQNLSLRIKHYKIFERGRRCYFEGEDRSRAFLWQDSPFYSLPLFQHCMRVPDRFKDANVFCREALLALSPAAARAPETSSGYAPASWQYAAYHRAKAVALNSPAPLVRLLRFLVPSETGYIPPRWQTDYLKHEFGAHSPLAELLEHSHVLPALEELKTEHAFFCLWTVAMLEKAYRGRIFTQS